MNFSIIIICNKKRLDLASNCKDTSAVAVLCGPVSLFVCSTEHGSTASPLDTDMKINIQYL